MMMTATSGSSKQRTKRVPFPQRLFHLLKLAEELGWEDIISWVDDGTGFKVHDREKFEKLLLVKYFNTTRYASFTRQLHAYNFDCVRTGRQTGIYSHPGFTRDNPTASCSLERVESSKTTNHSKDAISKQKDKAQRVMHNVANFQQGFRAGDTIVQFPSLLRPNFHDDDTSSLSSHSDSGSTSTHHQPSRMMTGLYNTVCSQVANRTRQALIRIPPEASESLFSINQDNGFWSLTTGRMRTISDVSSPRSAVKSSSYIKEQHVQPSFQQSHTNMNTVSPATQPNDISKLLYGMSNTVSDDAFDPIPLESEEEESSDGFEDFQFGDLEPLPLSPADEHETQSLDSSILEPRSIQNMVQNPQNLNAEWWYNSAPTLETPRQRAMVEFSLPVSLPLGFFALGVSRFGIYWITFLMLGHFVECLFTAWGGSEDRKDKTYTKDFNIVKPAIGMLQHHVMDLLWFHALLSNMMLTPELFGPPCYRLLYLFMWPQPINLAVVIKTHYCESKLEGSYAHEKYWLGDIIKKSIAGYVLTMIGVIVMHLFEMNYLRVPLVFGFNMIPLWAFESYRYLLSIPLMLSASSSVVSNEKKHN